MEFNDIKEKLVEEGYISQLVADSVQVDTEEAYLFAPSEIDASDPKEDSLESMLKHQGKYVPDYVYGYSWMTDLDLILGVVLYQDEILDCQVQAI